MRSYVLRLKVTTAALDYVNPLQEPLKICMRVPSVDMNDRDDVCFGFRNRNGLWSCTNDLSPTEDPEFPDCNEKRTSERKIEREKATEFLLSNFFFNSALRSYKSFFGVCLYSTR